VTATSCELQPCRSSNVPKTWLTGFLQPLPGDFQSNDVTSGHVGSHKLISCHVTTTSCEFQPWRSKVPKTCLIGPLQPLPGDFRANDVTSRSLPVTWGHCGHFLSCDRHLLRVTALEKLKRTQNFSLLVTWGHVTSFPVTCCHLVRVTA